MMKYKHLVVSVLTLFVSVICKADFIALEDAVSIANRFLSANAASWQVDMKRNSSLLRTPSQDKSNYYIFKGNDNRGFVIVSADDIARPILGYSFDAAISDTEVLPTGMQDWLDDIDMQIRTARESGDESIGSYPQDVSSLSTGDLIVKLETAEWGQGAPFNNKCPLYNGKRCLAGCAPMAWAILMKYYGYPTSGKGTTPSYRTNDYGISVASRNLNHSYNWDSMLLKYVSGQYNVTESNQVSTLVADIGAALQVDYGVNETWGYFSINPIYTYFDYNPGTQEPKDYYSVEAWYAKLREELDKQHPVVYRAEDAKNGGHFFIIDGYTDDDYFSVNWGWGGDYNGCYALDALPSNLYYTNQSAYFGCMPMPMCEDPAVVEMNGLGYPTLKIAIAAAPSDGIQSSIKFLSDITSDWVNIEKDKDIVWDMNGKNVNLFNGIENHGKLSVLNQGGGQVMNIYGNHELLVNYGDLTIFSGTFVNPFAQSYCRCVWSAAGSTTLIHSGSFNTNGASVFCFNGEAIIEDGSFICEGNSEIVSNYNHEGQIIIRGGSFYNFSLSPSGTDYRRAIWTDAGSNTIIEDGTFCSPYQVFCFNGDATIYNGTIQNTESGYGIKAYSGSLVSVLNCKLKADNPFYSAFNSAIICEGGLFSKKIGDKYIKDRYICTLNTDEDTCNEYPYSVVEDPVGIMGISSDTQESYPSYNLCGQRVNESSSHGIIIQNGRKQLRK